MAKHTMIELQELQALPLSLKVGLTKSRIREWVKEYGSDKVYISFSGGKDSTVLLHLVREDNPDVKAIYINTRLEYPEIVDFVRTHDNIIEIEPKNTFREVICKCGYPLFSKEISNCVYGARKYLRWLIDNEGMGGRRFLCLLVSDGDRNWGIFQRD